MSGLEKKERKSYRLWLVWKKKERKSYRLCQDRKKDRKSYRLWQVGEQRNARLMDDDSWQFVATHANSWQVTTSTENFSLPNFSFFPWSLIIFLFEINHWTFFSANISFFPGSTNNCLFWPPQSTYSETTPNLDKVFKQPLAEAPRFRAAPTEPACDKRNEPKFS